MNLCIVMCSSLDQILVHARAVSANDVTMCTVVHVIRLGVKYFQKYLNANANTFQIFNANPFYFSSNANANTFQKYLKF